MTSSHLLVGTYSGLIQVYDIASHQLLRSISTHKGFSITHLTTMLKPPDLVGHVSLSLGGGGDSKEPVSVRHITPFQRMRDPKTREAHEVGIMLTGSSSVSVCIFCVSYSQRSNLTPILSNQRPTESFFEYSTDEILRDYSTFVQQSSSDSNSKTQPTGVSLQTRVEELESEVFKLREQLGKAKGINDTMWETVVHRMVNEGKGKGRSSSGSGVQEGFVSLEDGEQGEDGGRRRKRSRA